MDGCRDEWMLRWMDQFINFLLWMDDGWMDGWMDQLICLTS